MTSKYFPLSEFQAVGFPVAPSDYQSFLMGNMVKKILEPIRGEINTPMQITDCARTMEKTAYMIERGLYPSLTSDHYWGLSVPLNGASSLDKVKVYGQSFSLSVGAVDFTVEGVDIWPIFKTVVKMAKVGFINCGQVIYEKGNSRAWIHISNPKELVYSKDFCAAMFSGQRRFLFSNNGGQNYQEFEV